MAKWFSQKCIWLIIFLDCHSNIGFSSVLFKWENQEFPLQEQWTETTIWLTVEEGPKYGRETRYYKAIDSRKVSVDVCIEVSILILKKNPLKIEWNKLHEKYDDSIFLPPRIISAPVVWSRTY